MLYLFEKKKPRIPKNINPRNIIFLIIFVIMIIPYIMFIELNEPAPHYAYEKGEYYVLFSMDNIMNNWPRYNLYAFFFSGEFHPLILSIFSLSSLLFLRTSMKKRIIFLWIWFSLFYIFFFSYFLLRERHFLISYFPLILLAGYSVFEFSTYLRGYLKNLL